MSLDDREGGEVKLNENESLKDVTIAAKILTKRAWNTESESNLEAKEWI